jgi:hypothetical protein
MPLTAERKLKQANHNGAMEICWSAQTRNREQVMPGGDAAAGTLAVPIWLAGAAAAVFVVAILLAVKRAGGVALITSLFRVGLIAAAVLGAWLYVQQRGSERRAFDDRKAVLIAGSIAPGSALSCLDELAGEAVEAACEEAVFASPGAVASAVKYVTAQLALLNDGTAYVAHGDAAYASELAPLRTAIELDRFGLVAQVLKERDGCTVERCDALTQLRDSTRVLGNLRERTFEQQVKKYTAIWNAPRPATGVVAAAGPSVALPGTSGPGSVASLPRDPAAAEPAFAAIAPPAALGSVASPPQEQPPPQGIVVATPQGPPPLPRDAAAEPAPQSAAVTPPAALGSVTAPPQEPPPLRGSVTAPPQEPSSPRDAAAAEPALQSAAVAPPTALGGVTPLPPRRPPQVRVAPPPRATAPP